MYLPGDVMQETLLNLLLRNYLHYNLYDQAEKLRSKAPRFEAHSNQQVYTVILSVKGFLTMVNAISTFYTWSETLE
jgi:26S proteasome regulatory subunit N3